MSRLLSLITAAGLALTSVGASAQEMPEPRIESITIEEGSTDEVPVEEEDPYTKFFLGSMFIGGTGEGSFKERHFFDTWFDMKAKDGSQVSIISTNPLDVNIGEDVLPEDRRYPFAKVGGRLPFFYDTFRVSAGTSGSWGGVDNANLGTRLDLFSTKPVTPRAGYLLDSEKGSGGFGGVQFNAPVLEGVLHGDVDVVGYDGVFDVRGFGSVVLPFSDVENAPRIYFALGGKLDDRVGVSDVGILSEGLSFSYLSQGNLDGEYHGKLHLAFMGANWKQGNLDFPMHIGSGTGNRVQDNGQGLRVLDGWAPFDVWFAKKGPVFVGNFHVVDGHVSGDATFYLLEPLGGKIETFGGVRVGYDGEPSFGGEAHLLVHLDKRFGVELWANGDCKLGSKVVNGIGYAGLLFNLP